MQSENDFQLFYNLSKNQWLSASTRKIYHYGRAKAEAIARAIREFPWAEKLKDLSPTQQVRLLNSTFSNIMSNFIPNEQKTFRPSEPPWLTKNIKAYLRKHNKIYRKFKQSGFNDVERVQVEQSKSKINDLILDAKEKYLQSQSGACRPFHWFEKILENSQLIPEQMQSAKNPPTL